VQAWVHLEKGPKKKSGHTGSSPDRLTGAGGGIMDKRLLKRVNRRRILLSPGPHQGGERRKGNGVGGAACFRMGKQTDQIGERKRAQGQSKKLYGNPKREGGDATHHRRVRYGLSDGLRKKM